MSKAKPSNIINNPYSYDAVSLASSAGMSHPRKYSHASSMTLSHDSFSIGSDMSSLLAPQRRCPFCPAMCTSSAHSQHSYREVKREMEQLVRSKDDLFRAEMRLQAEKERGKFLLIICLIMALFCSVIFMDQMPRDWKAILVEYLEKDGKESQAIVKSKDYNPNDSIKTTSTGWDGTYEFSHNRSIVSAAPTYSPTEHQTQNKIQSSISEDILSISEDIDKLLISILDKRVTKLNYYNRWNIPFLLERETAVYWHIPRTAGGMVNKMLSQCYGLLQAADDVGVLSAYEEGSTLKKITDEDGGMYLNVDMSTPEGIQRAYDMKLTSWYEPMTIRTPYLFDTAVLFSPGNYGKCFAMLRDPIERVMDVFQYLKDTKTPVFVNMTLEEYVKSDYCEQNWMVRNLSDETDGDLRQEHMEMAQHVLGRKCIVGFTDRLEESVRRFAKFFKWDQDVSPIKVRDCLSNLLSKDKIKSSFSWQVPVSKNPKYGEGSIVWEILKEKNYLDIELYKYAKNLFDSQSLYVARL